MGGSEHGGEQWTVGSETFTAKTADDRAAGEGGFFLSQQDAETGEKSTWTFDRHYNLMKVDGDDV